MEKKGKLKIGVTDLLLAAGSLCFLLGQIFFFHACQAHEDGSWMSCHWADMAERGAACLLVVLGLAHLAAPAPGVKEGLSLGMLGTAVLAAVIPGGLISLCMMEAMRCRQIMRPADLVFAVLIAAVAVADMILQRNRRKKA